MKEVNLFESYLKAPGQAVKFSRSVKIATVVALTAYCVTASAVFSYWLILKQKVSSLDWKIEEQKELIASLEPVEILHVLIKERLKLLAAETLSERADLSLVLSEVEKLILPGISIKDIAAGAGGELKLSGEAEDAVVLAEFFGRLMEMSKEKKEARVEVSGVSRAKTGSYNFSITSNVQ